MNIKVNSYEHKSSTWNNSFPQFFPQKTEKTAKKNFEFQKLPYDVLEKIKSYLEFHLIFWEKNPNKTINGKRIKSTETTWFSNRIEWKVNEMENFGVKK